MKLSDIKGEDAIEVLADILDPITKIMADPEIAQAFKTKAMVEGVKIMLKKYKSDVLYIFARLENEDPDTYEVSLVALPKKVFELINDPELTSLFTSQAQSENADSSGSATENIEATEEA